VRVGEQSLKSEQVQRRWQQIFLQNIRAALDSAKLRYRIEQDRSRVFVYSATTEKVIKSLGKVFGITSLSPCYVTKPDEKDVAKIAVTLAKKMKIGPRKSFAIRATRVGEHPFNSQEIAGKTGYAVQKATKAPVDLTKPEAEIEIEVRPKKAFVFSERIEGPGGMPLGTAGKAVAYVNDKKSALAAWMAARRGVQLAVYSKNKQSKWVKKLAEWHLGKKFRIHGKCKPHKAVEEEKVEAVIIGDKFDKKLEDKFTKQKILILKPLEGLSSEEFAYFARKAGFRH